MRQSGLSKYPFLVVEADFLSRTRNTYALGWRIFLKVRLILGDITFLDFGTL